MGLEGFIPMFHRQVTRNICSLLPSLVHKAAPLQLKGIKCQRLCDKIDTLHCIILMARSRVGALSISPSSALHHLYEWHRSAYIAYIVTNTILLTGFLRFSSNVKRDAGHDILVHKCTQYVMQILPAESCG